MSCSHPTSEYGKVIMASGEIHIRYRCRACHKNLNTNGEWVGKKMLIAKNIDIESLPVFDDYTENNPTCAVCGRRGTELHHFAPKELFPETFELWPKSYLCKEHHQEWHNKITVPLRKYRNRERKMDNGQPDVATRSELSQ